MDWLCWVIGGLLIVGLLVTVVGHGMWVLLAALFGSGSKSPAPRYQPGDDLARTEAQLKRLLQAGLIDNATYDRVIGAIQTLRVRQIARPVIPVVPPPARQEPTPFAIPSEPQPDIAPPAPAVILPTAPVADLPFPKFEPPPQPKPVAPPRPPKKPMSEVLAAFMRESNIRWGELIGGLLIIGGSIALVISFWNQIAGKPFFQFGIFTTVTAALMGLGLYAEHRWKLPTTSRGILLIATLLVPLNFVAFAALSHGVPSAPLVTIVELAALVLFAFLLTRAAMVLSPHWPWLLSAGIAGQCGSLVLTKHLGPAHSVPLLWGLAAIPVAFHEITLGTLLARARRWRRIHEHAAEAMLLLLGVMTFATAMAIGLVIFQVEPAWQAAHRLAPLLSLVLAPGLGIGLLLWRGIAGKKLANLRMAGTSLAIISAGLMLAAIYLAWPDPAQMLPLAVIDFIVLSAIGLLFEFPASHLLAGPCLLLAYLLGFHLLRHHVSWNADANELIEALKGPGGGTALVAMCALMAGIAVVLRHCQKPSHARMYGMLAGATALISVALVSAGGFARPGDPYGATWVYLIYAAVGMAIAWRTRRVEAGWWGCLLLAGAFVQFFVTRTSIVQPWPTALLACATAATSAFILMGALRQEREAVQAPLKGTAIGTCLIALILLLFGLSLPATGIIASRLIWMAALWFAMGLAEDSTEFFIAAEAILFLAIALRTLGAVATSPWFHELNVPLLDPRTLQPIGLALGLTALGFALLRQFLPTRWQQLRPRCAASAFDRALSATLAVGLGAMVVSATVPALQIEYATVAHPPAVTEWVTYAIAARSWAILGVVLLSLVLWVWKTKSREVVLGIIAAAAIACPLWADRWADVGAAASALRWAAAVFLVLASIPLWPRIHMPGALGEHLLDGGFRRDFRALLVALCAAPILLLTLYPAELTLSGQRFAGPVSSCFFGAIGNSVSYVIPLLVLAIVFVSYAVHERSTAWAVAAAAVFNLTTTLGYALAVATKGGSLGTHELIRLVQLNVLTLALFSLFWQAARAMVYRSTSLQTPAPLWTLAALCVAGNLLLILPAGLHLFGSPQWQSPHLSTIGDPLGWLALALTLAALGIPLRQSGRWMSAGVVAPLLIAIALMGALGAQRSSQSTWISFHIALCGFVLAAGALPGTAVLIARRHRGVAELIAAPRLFAEPSTDSSIPPIPLQYQRDDRSTSGPSELVNSEGIEPGFLRWTAALTSIAIMFSLRGMFGDPQRPWWSASAALLLSILWIGVACWSLAPRLLYVGGMLLNLGVSFWCIDNFSASREPLLDLLLANVGVVALFGIATLVVHLHVFVPRLKRDSRLSFHQFAAGLCPVLTVFVAAAAASTPVLPNPALLWAAWAGSLACAVATLWDSRSRFAPLEIYLLGLSTVGMLLGQWPLPPQEFHWEATLLLGAFVLAASALVGLRESLVQLAAWVGMPQPDEPRPTSWILPANLVLGAIVVGRAIAGDFSLWLPRLRITAAAAALGQLIGPLLATRVDRRSAIRAGIAGIAAAAMIAFGWSFMDPARTAVLDRAAVAIVVLAFAAALYLAVSILLSQTDVEWSRTLRQSATWIGAAWAITVAGMLAIEIVEQFSLGHVTISVASVVAVAVALLVAPSAAIILALRRKPDPFGISDARRGAYVYCAEGLLALLLVHLRLTEPWLFGGLLSQYWPLVIMAVAFGGVGLSELFRRRNLLVLSDPLMRTGIFLPLLPVLAFWALPTRVEFSNVLFVVGLFYAILSATRHSFVLGVLAALAANGGLWALLHRHPQLGFLLHPQVWLIPAALSVLAAAHLNRDRLTAAQLRFVRYCCLMVIYVSSTADVFINGVANHPLLPLILAALSVAGVMTGILFRLRAFLFLGTAFLVLSIGTMIEFASVNFGWTWLWWISVIAMGGIILAVFALIEKKRVEMLAIVEGLKQWQ